MQNKIINLQKATDEEDTKMNILTTQLEEMIKNISSFSGPGGATRKECINLIKTIAKSEEVN